MEENKKTMYFIVLSIITSVYMILYSLTAIWFWFDGWMNNFSSLHCFWNISGEEGFSSSVIFSLFTILGSVFGGALLSITSFHRHFAIEKKFDTDHLWGFFFTPILSIIVGIIVFTLIQSGLLVLSGVSDNKENISNAALGFTAIGSVAGYNWDVFIRKLQDLSKLINNKHQQT
ncbi:hypothetical protein [Aeromonas jandaei]|uniref:hypothetical protein n=1 Tax=Aeromonas jandaei TaxID=650 RepID=UPI0039888ADB